MFVALAFKLFGVKQNEQTNEQKQFNTLIIKKNLLNLLIMFTRDLDSLKRVKNVH